MSTVIRAHCDDCGDVELSTADVQVRVRAHDRQGTYIFRCPTCSMRVVKPAEPRIVDILVSSGVEMATWSMPAELDEARPGGSQFTHDDLIDFHQLLGSDGWLARLHAADR